MSRLRPAASSRGFGGLGRAGAAIVVAIALAAGLSLRLARLDARPMHHDEANQAIKFGALLERGDYVYDAFDHHGPTLYYLTLPVAWLRGQATLASLDEWTLRIVPVAFGAATLLLLPLLPAAVDRTAKASAALLMAVSPAMVFYSQMYIQESMFACFALAFTIALGRSLTEPGLRWPIVAGIAAGLTVATKETSAIVLPTALIAAGAAWASLGPARASLGTGARRGRSAVLAIGVAAGIAAIFYSSFLTHPAAILEPFRAAPTYVSRGVDAGDHVHPWHFYLARLGWWSTGGLRWSEGAILALAAIGLAAAWTRPDPDRPEATFWRRFLTGNAALTLAVYSLIPYKTPWNLVPFYALTIGAAGVGVAALARGLASRPARLGLAAAVTLAAAHLGWQAWRASVVYAADPRNPYVYAQTVPDGVRLAARIRDLATLHPDRERMLVMVVAPPNDQWPLPWYLRTMPHVGYWPDATDLPDLQAPVVVASEGHVERFDAALGDRYVSEFFGLRPEVLLTVYVERALWDRFLKRAALGGG
jgi:uncharacterized protein (TIGR03663 family)